MSVEVLVRNRNRKDNKVPGPSRSDPSDSDKKDVSREAGIAGDKKRRGAAPTDAASRGKLEHRLRADTNNDFEDADKDSSAATIHRDEECSES